MPDAPPIRNLTTNQIAAELGRFPATIARWVRNGWIPCEKANARVFLYNLAEVEEAMKASRLKRGKPKSKSPCPNG